MANVKQLIELLSRGGWGSGFKLPIANEENKALEEELDRKQALLLRLSTDLQEESLAVDKSTAYHKHLQSKMRHVKDLEAAQRGQMEKEKHYAALAERDLAKTEQDVRNLEKRLKAMKEQNRILEGNVLRRKDTLAELVDTINFDMTAITAYEKKLEKEDAYIKLVDDFADTDNEKVVRCRDEYQALGETVVNSKRQLDATISESEILESELNALAKRFRKAQEERAQFVENWKGTLAALENRDKEIMEIGYDYQSSTLKMKNTTALLERQENLYEKIQLQTRCYLGELNRLERKMHHLFTNKRQLEVSTQEGSDAITDLGSDIRQLDKELRTVQKQLNTLITSMDDWEGKMKQLKADIEELKAKYDVITMEKVTSAEQTKQLREFVEKEEKQGELLSKELEKQINVRTHTERHKREIMEKVVLAQSHLRTLKAALANIRKESNEKGDIFIKFQAIAYRLDLKAMQLETKIRTFQNPESQYASAEYIAIQGKINELRRNYEELVKTKGLIRAQVVHSQLVDSNCKREIQKEGEQNKNYEEYSLTLQMEIRRIVKENEVLTEKIKDDGVDNSLLNLTLRKMLQSLKDTGDKMYCLEQERVSLQAIVKTRKKDIETFCAFLLGKKRNLLDESQKLRAKCMDANNDAQSRKRKYEMIMMQMWAGSERPDDSTSAPGGGARSEAYFIIKMAQEKEYYRQEGDKWDERVKEAEKVVEGLQNTLALMMGTNEVFKDSLKPATADTPKAEELRNEKEKQLRQAYNLKVVREKRNQCALQLQQKQTELHNLTTVKREAEQELLEKQYEFQNLMGEITGQKEKIRRATLQANRLVKELSKMELLDAELLQNDLRLRVTKEKYEFGIATLEKLLSIYPDLVGESLEFLRRKGMSSLVLRLTRKLVSPSLSASPHQSGTSTPKSNRSSVSGRRRSTRVSVSSAQPSRSSIKRDTDDSKTQLSQRPSRKSVGFEAPTATPSAKKMLTNIASGLKTKEIEDDRTPPASGLIAPRPTGGPEETEDGNDAISFGELRQALQEAVEEQQKYAVDQLQKLEKDEARPSTSSKVGVPAENKAAKGSVDVLVDKRREFTDTVEDKHEDT